MATSALEKSGLAEASGERKPMARGTSASANSSRLEQMVTMASEFGMFPVGPGPSLLFYDARTPKNRCLLYAAGRSGDGDLYPRTVDFHGQQAAACIGYGFLHAGSRLRLDQNHYATAAARPANLPREGAFSTRAVNNAVDGLGRNGRQVPFAKIPFFAHQAAGFIPIRLFEGQAHGLCHFGDPLKVASHRFLTVDMRLENLPVVYTRLPGLAGVAENQALFELAHVETQFHPALATRRQLNRRRSSERGRVVILGAGGHFDDDTLGIAADVDPVHFALARRREPVERGANGHGHRGRTADPGARRSFRIRSQGESTLRGEKLGNLGQQGQVIVPGLDHRGERGEVFLALGVARNQTNFFVAARMSFYDAAGIARHRGVNGYGAGMK